MADTNATEEGVEQQISFIVKSSSDQKFTLSLPATTTIGDLKQKLSTAEYANITANRQRLIYSGRVLKDADTLGVCKIKDGNTIHLVKGAESNSRQNPAASTTTGTPNPAANIPSNIASGPGANNPLAQLTGARYAGMHGLPSMDTFGADAGMGAPPNSDQMLRLLEDPNFAQQMNEAMNHPAVLDMLRNNPMIRNNPMARAALDNPELRSMLMNPQMIRMQMQMQRAMGQQGGTGNFPMPGQTDTADAAAGTTGTTATTTTGTADTTLPPNAANPFAALFPQGTPAGAGSENVQDNMQRLLSGGEAPDASTNQMLAALTQNPEMMESMRRMMGGGGMPGDAGAPFNPFGAFASSAPPAPADNRPPEERYADQLRQLNDMGFFEFERNVQALRRSGGSVQGAVEYLLSSL